MIIGNGMNGYVMKLLSNLVELVGCVLMVSFGFYLLEVPETLNFKETILHVLGGLCIFCAYDVARGLKNLVFRV